MILERITDDEGICKQTQADNEIKFSKLKAEIKNQTTSIGAIKGVSDLVVTKVENMREELNVLTRMTSESDTRIIES
jgi:hypothetical protein